MLNAALTCDGAANLYSVRGVSEDEMSAETAQKGDKGLRSPSVTADKAMITHYPKVVWLRDGTGWHEIRNRVIAIEMLPVSVSRLETALIVQTAAPPLPGPALDI